MPSPAKPSSRSTLAAVLAHGLTALLCASAAACRADRPPGHATGASTGVQRQVPATSRSATIVDSARTGADSTPSPRRDSASAEPAAPSPSRAPVRGPRHVTLGDIDLTGVGYDRGSATAPVVVIDLSDFACPYCGEFSRETYPAIEREYVRTGKVFFKYVPFVAGPFRHSREATRAAECAAEQDRFWPMLDGIYAEQRAWKQAGDPQRVLLGLAKAAGVDSSRFAQCVESGRTDARTARATGIANDIGVRVTPSFAVNGRPVEGALPLADFRRVIDAALLLLDKDR